MGNVGLKGCVRYASQRNEGLNGEEGDAYVWTTNYPLHDKLPAGETGCPPMDVSWIERIE